MKQPRTRLLPDLTQSGSRRRQLGTLVLSIGGATVTTAALVLVPAMAEAAVAGSSLSSPVVSSSSAALTTTLPGFTLATGASSAAATSSGTLQAKGAGVLQPSPSGSTEATATPGHSQSVPSTCGGALPAFPAPLTGAVTASAACGSAEAKSASAESGSASGTGQAASLDVDLAPLLTQVVTSGSPLASALQSVLGQLPSIPGGGESVSTLLGSAESSLTGDQTLQVAAGVSSSTSTVSPNSFATTAKATGATITILPGGGTGGAALAKIIIGGASATASVDRTSTSDLVAKPSASDTPALVTVEVDAPGVGDKTYSVVPDQTMTILSGTPLQTTISVAAGSVTTAPSGAVTASASGVKVDLAQGVGATTATGENGGLDLVFADASATALPQSHPALKATHHSKPHPAHRPVLTSSSVPNATVPHTGLPWAGAAPVLAAGALAGAGLLWWPRLRRRVRSSRP